MDGAFDLIDLLFILHRNMKRVCQSIEKIEKTTHQCEFNNFFFGEFFPHPLEDAVVFLGGVQGDVFSPENGHFFTVGEQARLEVFAGADLDGLFFRNACRLTKRRIMRESITARVDVAGFNDHHFLDLGGQKTARPFPLHGSIEGQ